jgi:hypothetical protein
MLSRYDFTFTWYLKQEHKNIPLINFISEKVHFFSAKGIKRSGILRGFQKCAEVLSLAKRKKKFIEKLIF